MPDAVIEVRALSLADYDAMIAVWTAAGNHISRREAPDAFAAQMRSGLQTALGAFVDGNLVGVALVTHDGRKGWINRLGVRPEYQRQGVGRALIAESERVITGMGLEITAALVEHDNPASLALFKSMGYHVHETYYVSKRSSPDA
jgi:ribosomal protein S18 acetylase RimI-like enzyme